MTQIKTGMLTLEGLKVYKEKSPSKFHDKFGDLDFDNLPDDWDLSTPDTTYASICAYRSKLLEKRPKTPLMPELNSIKVEEKIKFEEVKVEKVVKPKKVIKKNK